MAGLLAARRAIAAGLTAGGKVQMLQPLAVAAAPRMYNTASQLRRYEDDDGDDAVDRRPAAGRRFLDAFDPFAPPRSLSQLMNLMDSFVDASPFSGTAMPFPGAQRRSWEAREDENALHLRVDMPGLGKEHVQVTAEQSTLVIKGEGEDDWGEGASQEAGKESKKRYMSRIDLQPDSYMMDKIKAEMRNGVLKITVPKVKPEERKEVFNVSID